MFSKVTLCAAFYSILRFYVTPKSFEGHEDKAWLESFLIIMTFYYLLTSSLYILTYPMSEMFQEVPVKIAFLLMRLLTAVIFVSITHLYFGISREFEDSSDIVDASNPESTLIDEVLRALRILGSLFLIGFTLFLFGALIPLCNVSGLDGSRVRRPNVYREFGKITFGSLIF